MDYYAWMQLLHGAWTTAWISAVSIALGVVIGLVIALIRMAKLPIIDQALGSMSVGLERHLWSPWPYLSFSLFHPLASTSTNISLPSYV